ncbi:MAG: Zn-ribbon domain-containing OB-fold protein [Rhodobacteraceae bacterium]|jgi:uncharacterized OB-fold protein|nr:Zn-ribbon domain-containing OB-fold protein [Paracoccaceae bacterium]
MKPVIDNDSAPYWEGLKQGRLLIQRCPSTGRYQWYPRGHSIHDPTAIPEWVEASGTGEVFSFTVIHRGNTKRPPYNCAMIRLDEGVIMLASLRGIEEADLRIGQRVRVDFEPLDDEITLPVFRPL